MKNNDLPHPLPIVVAAAIIHQGKQILLTRRKPEAELGGFWEFPGGKQESGETLEGCVRREVKEELGVEISEPRFFHSLRYQYPEKEVELHFFSCSIIQGQPQALDCAEIAWVYKHELFSFEFPPADTAVLSKIIQTGGSEESVS